MSNNDDKKFIQIDVHEIKEVSFNDILIQFTNLTNSIISKWSSLDSEEVKQTCFIGLWKAFKSYDIEKKATFGFYAKKIILNDIYASKRKQSDTLSLNAPCTNNLDTLTEHIDNVKSNDSFTEEDVIYNSFINEYLIYFPDIDKKIFDLYFIKKYTQNEIANVLNYTQPSICYKIKELISNLKKIYEIDPIINLFPSSIRSIIIRNYILDNINLYVKTISVADLLKITSTLHTTLKKIRKKGTKENVKFMNWLNSTEEILLEYITLFQYNYEQDQLETITDINTKTSYNFRQLSFFQNPFNTDTKMIL